MPLHPLRQLGGLGGRTMAAADAGVEKLRSRFKKARNDDVSCDARGGKDGKQACGPRGYQSMSFRATDASDRALVSQQSTSKPGTGELEGSNEGKRM